MTLHHGGQRCWLELATAPVGGLMAWQFEIRGEASCAGRVYWAYLPRTPNFACSLLEQKECLLVATFPQSGPCHQPESWIAELSVVDMQPVVLPRGRC